MKKKTNTHVTGEHNINGNNNEALTGFQKANVNYTKTESGTGAFLFGVVLLILFSVNVAFMFYVKTQLVTIAEGLNAKQIEFENKVNTQIDIIHTRIDKHIVPYRSK